MKIMKKIVIRDLKMNKVRCFATFIAIILSISLITVAVNMVEGIEKTMNNYFQKQYGNYDISLIFDPAYKDSGKKISLNRNVQSLYIKRRIGLSLFENSRSNYRKAIEISAYNREAFGECFDFALKEGRYPENSNEVVLSENFVDFSNKVYRVGDKITLDIGSYYTGKSGDYNFALFESCFDDNFKFVKSFTKTYTVTGILEREPQEELYNDLEYYRQVVNIYTCAELSDVLETAYTVTNRKPQTDDEKYLFPQRFYIKLKGTNDISLSFLSDITGIDEDTLNDYFFNEYSDRNGTDEKLNGCDMHIWGAEINADLHRYSQIANSVVFCAGIAVIVIIMISSIFIIKNAFSVSVIEKTVLYGRLISIGAAPIQIRNSVFFEGFILCIAGIPAGLIIGAVGVAALSSLSNMFVPDFLDGTMLETCISPLSVLLAVLLGFATVFLSCLSASMRASEISPIEAVRKNRDIKGINNKKLKCPRWAVKIFGEGGKIAWKNMKRSRRQYRTTVISAALGVGIFISSAAFVECTSYLYSQDIKDYKYNISLQSSCGMSDNGTNTLDKIEDIYMRISSFDEVDNYYYCFENNVGAYTYDLPKSKMPSEMKKAQWFDENIQGDIESGELTGGFFVYVYDEITYRKLLEKYGLKYDDVKDKAIFVNVVTAGYEDKNDSENPIKEYNCRIIDNPVGYTVNAECCYAEDTGRPHEISIEIGAEITDLSVFEDIMETWCIPKGGFIVTTDWLRENIKQYDIFGSMFLNSSEPAKTERRLNEFSDYISLNNRSNEMQMTYSFLSLIQFFVYGFICVIALIGITNMINTISTNTKLRQREYAVLRSVGMTKREFKSMTLLESLFCTTKSLLAGIILGLAGTFIVRYFYFGSFYPQDNDIQLPFIFPWAAIIISIAVVSITIFTVTMISARKSYNRNIIETIRNDNI